jgi:Spy/CpxP family protein refolding chaperone
MKYFRLLGAVTVAALLVPVGALAQTIPPEAAPPPGTVPAQVAPYPATPYAAPGARRGHGKRGAYMRIVNSLPLNNYQRQQIAQDVATARQADQGANRRTKRRNRKQLHQQIDSILTPDQLAQVRAQMEASRGQRQQSRYAAPAQPNGVPVPSGGVAVPNT